MRVIFYILMLVALALAQQPEQTPDPIVTISQGTVVGSNSLFGEYFEFHGIPYADATSGIHRFKAPLPAPSFQDTFIANRRNVKCVRALGVGYEGTEDCLVANIFTPSIDSSRQLPVMVFVKGKEFDQVDGKELSFRNFVNQDVVVVSLNYRESILGFLCLGTETAPGNAGLKDIIAGLRWVQENIGQFGGNPNDVTLVGHGSGAAAVDLVSMSPMATGLVHKAIAQSGNAMAPWAVSRDNLQYAIKVAEGLGIIVNSVQDLSNVFTRTSVSALMAVINDLDLTDNSLAFAPCIEKTDLPDVEPFLVKPPSQILADGDFLQIPFITGFVDNEGTIRSEEALEGDWLERMDTSFTDFIQPDLEFDNENQEQQVAQQIRTFYFGQDSINIESIDEYIEYQGDTLMLVSAIREARQRAFTSAAPTYLYQFSYKGPLGQPFVGPLDVESAAHSEELAYMFYETVDITTPVRDLAIGDILIERWTNFAKTGNPQSTSSQVTWLPFTNMIANYIRILDNEEINAINGATLEIALQNPHTNTITFWDQLYIAHYLEPESIWEIEDRNDENDEAIGDGSQEAGGDEEENNTTAQPGDEDRDENGDENGDGNGDENGDDNGDDNDDDTDDGEEEDAPGSASTAVGFTFSIVSLFSILNYFHISQISS